MHLEHLTAACLRTHWLMPADLWNYRHNRPGPRNTRRFKAAPPALTDSRWPTAQAWTLRRDHHELRITATAGAVLTAQWDRPGKLTSITLDPAETAQALNRTRAQQAAWLEERARAHDRMLAKLNFAAQRAHAELTMRAY